MLSLSWYKRALEQFTANGGQLKLSMVHLNLGVTHYKTGDYKTSLDHLNQSLAVGKEGGWIHRQCFANIALGNVRRLQHEFETARRHLHEAYGQAQELGYPREEALALEFLGDVYRDESKYADARRFYDRAQAIAERIAPEGDIAMEVRRRLGECRLGEGDPKSAMNELNRALDLSRTQGDRFEEAATLRVLAQAVLELGDVGSARRWLDQSVAILEEIGAKHELAMSLLESAELALIEQERMMSAAAGSSHLDQAWQQATAALSELLDVDVAWWIEKARSLVDRIARLRSARERAESEVADAEGSIYDPGDTIIHASGRMRDLLQLTDMFASSLEPVLVTGETGTGKELIARRIHRISGRSGPLVTVNVAAITPSLFEREVFGHVRGAFSGAERDSEGFAARADGGTLFLDEIGDLPPEVQPKLLRLLQEGTYQAVGDPRERRVNIRLVAATNADLAQRVQRGEFRADLWYRLRILELDLPPVRERREDVLPLLRHFLSMAAGRHVELGDYFDSPSQRAAEDWHWPGNVREIAMAARRAHLERQRSGRVRVVLGENDSARLVLCGGPRAAMVATEGGLPSHEAVERTRIILTLEDSRGNRREAARRLGIGRSTLYRRMVKLGIPTKKA
ncbi:MAG: tetratricopeptide repeat protein [bacterium]|nr:tetratricopeptide repeat protein [bacterium]